MPRYVVYFAATAETSMEVEAEDSDEAIDLAWDQIEFPTLCTHCSGWGQKSSLSIGDWESNDTLRLED